MKLSALILSVLVIVSNIHAIVGQSSNINDLIISDLQILLSQTQQSIRAYLSTILVDAIIKNYYYPIIKNVDAIFASASLNLTTVLNKSYACSKLNILTSSNTSNCLFNL